MGVDPPLTRPYCCPTQVPQAHTRMGRRAAAAAPMRNKVRLIATAASKLAGVEQAPPDPILGVSEAFRASQDPNKLNLGVGAYRTEELQPYVLEVVKKVGQTGGGMYTGAAPDPHLHGEHASALNRWSSPQPHINVVGRLGGCMHRQVSKCRMSSTISSVSCSMSLALWAMDMQCRACMQRTRPPQDELKTFCHTCQCGQAAKAAACS